jgi:hypothetical protein
MAETRGINGGGHVNLPAGDGAQQQARGPSNGLGLKDTSHDRPVEGQGKSFGPRDEGPGLNGRGGADGQNKHDNQVGNRHDNQVGKRDADSKRNDAELPTRARENESRAQQIRNRVENSRPKSERLGDDAPGRDRSDNGVRARGDDDGGRRNQEVQFRSHVGDERSRAQGDDGHSRGLRDQTGRFQDQTGHVRDQSNGRGLFDQSSPGRSSFGHSHNTHDVPDGPRAGASDNAAEWASTRGHGHDNHGGLVSDLVGTVGRAADGLTHGHGHAHGVDARGLLESAADSAASRLDRMASGGGRQTRDALAYALTRDAGERGGEKVFKLLDHALNHLGQDLKHAGRDATRLGDDGGPFARLHGDSGEDGARFTVARGAEHHAREIVEELVSALQLNRHLNHLEKTGGTVVRQAEEAIARALYGANEIGRGLVGRPAHVDEPQPASPWSPSPSQRPTPQEVLRDLRAGAFLPAQERYSPFPLTGRARVAAEMMELMRTLDAVEGALRRASEGVAARKGLSDSAVAYLMRAKAGVAAAPENVVDELAALLTPSLPGRAARALIPAHVAAMNGLLTDADGRALLARDGAPLRLERLLWLSAAGGLLGSAFKGEGFPARTSPSLLYGFDAIYTVIGFDGRTLAAPHFVAVQAAANEAEEEWIFGRQPLTMGWARELIERLKDSAVVEHNLLGETLEEALADGRFHVALLSVEVREGAPAPDSSAVKHLLPGASAAFA